MENLTSYQAQTRRLFTILFGTAAIILSFAFLLQSAKPATADTAPSTITENGRYDMSFQAAMDNTTMNFYVLVWDTNTGRSKIYYGNPKKGSIGPAGSGFQLPSSPL